MSPLSQEFPYLNDIMALYFEQISDVMSQGTLHILMKKVAQINVQGVAHGPWFPCQNRGSWHHWGAMCEMAVSYHCQQGRIPEPLAAGTEVESGLVTESVSVYSINP